MAVWLQACATKVFSYLPRSKLYFFGRKLQQKDPMFSLNQSNVIALPALTKKIGPAALAIFHHRLFLRVRNFGGGPAIIERIEAFLRPVKHQDFPSPHKFSQCNNSAMLDIEAVPVGEFHQFQIFGEYLSPQDVDAIIKGDIHLVLYGRIRYGGVVRRGFLRNKQYETGFFWLTSPTGVALSKLIGEKNKSTPPATFMTKIDPGKRNYHT